MVAARPGPARREVTWAIAVAVGLAQLLAAVVPGHLARRPPPSLHRACCSGSARPAATEFSFLVGVPTLLAAGGLETLQALRHPDGPAAPSWGLLALGTVVSAVTASSPSAGCSAGCRPTASSPFGWYRIALGLVMLARFG